MMKSHFNILASIILFSLTAGQCKKDSSLKKGANQLPAVTQTGANTVGCLINGKVFIPEGYSGTGTPNPTRIFEIGLDGLPYLQIIARQYDAQRDQNGNLIIYVDSLVGMGIHKVYTAKKQIGFGSYLFPSCGILADDDVHFKSGAIEITKYDLNNGIISGLFDFKIKPADCDSLFFTEGRFDFKL